MGSYLFVKRVFDLVLSMALLIVFSPLILIIAVLILITMGRPVIFKQTRAGYLGRPFEVKKFRTMRARVSKDGIELSEAARITPLGRFLRKTSLDEIPQLWNVICGEMSLVGPRPLYVDYLDFYTEREHKRHDVRPGLTGLAQVSGRNYLPWDERLELDVQYVENVSLNNDIKLLAKTFLKVLSGADVSVVPGEARMLLSEERRRQSL